MAICVCCDARRGYVLVLVIGVTTIKCHRMMHDDDSAMQFCGRLVAQPVSLCARDG